MNLPDNFFLSSQYNTLMVRWWQPKNVGSKIWQEFLLCEHLIQTHFNSFWQLGSYVWCISIQMLLCTRAIFFPSEFLDPLFKSGQYYILFFFLTASLNLKILCYVLRIHSHIVTIRSSDKICMCYYRYIIISFMN